VDEIWLHPGSDDAVFCSAVKSLANPGVLNHTSIVIMQMKGDGNLINMEELALSTPSLPWGLHLLPCPNCCTPKFMCCTKNRGPRYHDKSIKVKCKKCQRQGTALQPMNAEVLRGSDVQVEGLVYVRLRHPVSLVVVDWKEI
jgi:hypothetical protein